MELYPAIDLRGGRRVRLLPGRLRRRRPSTATTRSPWRRGSPRPAPGGSTSSTSTPPAPASPSNRAVVAAIAAAVAGRACGCRRGGGVRVGGRGRGAGRRRRGPGRDGHGGAARTRRSSRRSPRRQPGRRRARRPRRRGGRARLDRGQRRTPCSTCCARFEEPASTRSSSPRSAATARWPGPTSTAWPRCWSARDLAGDRVGRRRHARRPAGPGRARVGGRGWPGSSSARRSTRAASTWWPGHAPCSAGAGRECAPPGSSPASTSTAGRVVKGVNFVGLRDAGDPVELAARYDAEGADELVFLDITASSRRPRHDGRRRARRTAEQVFIPFTVGGGIRAVDDARRLLRAGADKVSVNTSRGRSAPS